MTLQKKSKIVAFVLFLNAISAVATAANPGAASASKAPAAKSPCFGSINELKQSGSPLAVGMLDAVLSQSKKTKAGQLIEIPGGDMMPMKVTESCIDTPSTCQGPRKVRLGKNGKPIEKPRSTRILVQNDSTKLKIIIRNEKSGRDEKFPLEVCPTKTGAKLKFNYATKFCANKNDLSEFSRLMANIFSVPTCKSVNWKFTSDMAINAEKGTLGINTTFVRNGEGRPIRFLSSQVDLKSMFSSVPPRSVASEAPSLPSPAPGVN